MSNTDPEETEDNRNERLADHGRIQRDVTGINVAIYNIHNKVNKLKLSLYFL